MGKSSRTDLINTIAQSNMDLASETSEQRKHVKKMNQKFDHFEKLVRQLKRDSKILKDQIARLTKQVNEFKLSVSK